MTIIIDHIEWYHMRTLNTTLWVFSIQKITFNSYWLLNFNL